MKPTRWDRVGTANAALVDLREAQRKVSELLASHNRDDNEPEQIRKALDSIRFAIEDVKAYGRGGGR